MPKRIFVIFIVKWIAITALIIATSWDDPNMPFAVVTLSSWMLIALFLAKFIVKKGMQRGAKQDEIDKIIVEQSRQVEVQVYSPVIMVALCFIGGAFPAVWGLASNYRAIEMYRKARVVWIAAIVSYIVPLSLVMFPDYAEALEPFVVICFSALAIYLGAVALWQHKIFKSINTFNYSPLNYIVITLVSSMISSLYYFLVFVRQ